VLDVCVRVMLACRNCLPCLRTMFRIRLGQARARQGRPGQGLLAYFASQWRIYPSASIYSSACWRSICRLDDRLQLASYPCRVSPESEVHYAVCWFPDSSAVESEDADSGGRLRYGDAD